MSQTRAKKADRVVMSCLLLIGYIGAPGAHKILLHFSTPKRLGYIRRNALLGLKGVAFEGAAMNQVARQMLKYIAEPDFPNIGQHALDIIEKLPLPKSYESQWRKLLKSKHAPARAFAARRLAANDNAATNRLMMSLLAHDDAQVSEIAAGALARHKGATKLLLAALARERKSEPAWRLAKILKPHSAAVDKKSIKKLATLATRDLESGQARHEAIIYFLRNIDPQHADAVWYEAGRKFKKTKKWAKAAECLKQLARGDGFDTELRYELSVCNLKQSSKELALNLRADDQSLRGFQALLLDKKSKLYDRIRKDKALDARDLFYLGFHFSEGLGEEAKFGKQMLEYVAKRWSGTKDGKAARNKLKLGSPPAPVAASSSSASGTTR